MSNITKASVPGSRQRWGGLSLNKGSSLRGLFLAAVSGLFLTSALAADPNLTGPTTVVEDVAFDGGATPTRLVTNQLNLAWDKGGSNNIVQFRIFVGTKKGFGDIFPGAAAVETADINAVADENSYSQSYTVPTDGNDIWVRLHWLDASGAGSLEWRDYVYSAANQHYLTGPAANSTVPTATADGCLVVQDLTFTWEVASSLGEPNKWWVWAGTSPYTGAGSAHRNITNSGALSADSRSHTIAASNIPSDGGPIYVTLWYDTQADGDSTAQSDWEFVSADTAAIPYTIIYTSPSFPSLKVGGSSDTFPGTQGTFELSPNGQNVEFFWLYGGTNADPLLYHSAGSVIPGGSTATLTSQGFQNFPSNGEDILMTIYWRNAGEGPDKWKCRRQSFKASSGPIITAPAADSEGVLPVLPSNHDDISNSETLTFDPNGTNATSYQVIVNTSGDENDTTTAILNETVDAASGYTMDGTPISVSLPISSIKPNGTPLTVIVRYNVPGGVGEGGYDGFTKLTYNTKQIPHLVAPTSLGSNFASSLANEATFTWVDGGATVLGYWLYVGKTQGSNDYYNSGAGKGLTYTSQELVNKLPTDGSDVWVRLYYQVETTTSSNNADPDNDNSSSTNVWKKCDFKFTLPSSPEITDPGYGGTISGTQASLTMDTRGVGVTGTWITVSSEAPSGGSAENPNPSVDANNIIDNSGLLPAPAAGTTTVNYTVRNLPVDGSKVYATFWYLESSSQPSEAGRWSHRTFAYTSSNDNPTPTLTAPPISAAENATNEVAEDFTFTWSKGSTVVYGWWIYLSGTDGDGAGSAGGSNIYNSGFLQPGTSSVSVTGIPTGDNYLRIWYLDEFTDWKFVDYTVNRPAGSGGGGSGTPDEPVGSSD